MLRNGAFDGRCSPWNGEKHETAAATFAATSEGENGAPAARITDHRAGHG